MITTPTYACRFRLDLHFSNYSICISSTLETINMTTGNEPGNEPGKLETVPGQFKPGPNNENEKDTKPHTNEVPADFIAKWLEETVPIILHRLETDIIKFLSPVYPDLAQTGLYNAAAAQPASSSFLICQLICCGVPFLVQFLGMFAVSFVTGCLQMVLWLLVLVPTLFVAGLTGCFIWGFGWFIYWLIRWIDGEASLDNIKVFARRERRGYKPERAKTGEVKQ
ncbi:seipin co-factor family protein [Aspergillus tanneri]|uniref:Uncharacterized protein n=1 Tax=Aspergillus tanneri TaxID=1220188 RepID=A0A5M9MAD1_9EURO|nr:uncharacterized protein ATNIH1004_010623 [Aspergillus tanneri]KAA8643848.1 hypothetical protein ATNIH1004_010623 [Aspergillus tanneri]